MTTATVDLTAPSAVRTIAPAALPEPGFATGAPRALLRLEGLAMLVASAVAYVVLGERLWLFGALFLVPDLSLLGYLAGPRIGALVYNAGHSLIGPLALAGVALLTGGAAVLGCALVWVAHIGFDRALGYGLKYGTRFGDTHLVRLGR